ncbi:MAG: hypothetical protein IKQ72_06680 [Bacteroidaceae bacterium]|nr:hypothetical protein [Bacteroidaceae bacterium]
MNSKTNLFFVFVIFLSICSCIEHKTEKYDEINTLMETNPRKGLDEVLLMIKQNKDNSQYTKMKLALLKYKGEDKCDTIHTTDSIIKPIYEYFIDKGSNGEKLEVNYYMGRTYNDLHKYPLAITYYNKAIEIGDNYQIGRTDSMVLANVYSQLSGLYAIISDNKNRVKLSYKALQIRQKLGIDDISSYAPLATAYNFAGEIDSATLLHKQCIFKISNKKEIKDYVFYIAEELDFFCVHDETKMAEWTLNLAKSINKDSIPPLLNYSISSYYAFVHYNKDSCLYYAQKAYDKENDLKNKANYAQRIATIYAMNKDYKTAFNYAYSYFLLEDSIRNLESIDATISAQNSYHTQLIEKTKSELENEQSKIREYIAYGITALMALLSFFSVSLYLHGKKEKKYLADIEELEAAKSEIEEKHHNLAEIVEADNRLRAESAKDLASIVTRLKAIGYDPKECLTEDMWEDVFLAMDKLHPNLRSHILSYYKGIDNKDLILIYLTVLGMNQSDAARLFKNARSVTNRKFLRLNTRLGLPLNDVLKEYEDKYEESIIHKS